MSAATQSKVQINGDWTIGGVGQQLDLLSHLSLQDCSDCVAIDCSGVQEIDLSGLQLLYVWLHCIRLRGIQPSLCNVPDGMMSSLARLGMADNFDCNASASA